MELKCAVCDDEEVQIDTLKRLVCEWGKERNYLIKAHSFPSAEAFLFDYIEHKDYDILLLDIEMGTMDGVSLAKQIRAENEMIQIVFVTGFSDYIADGYEVSALHYLMKPVKREQLFAVLDRAVQKLEKSERTLTLSLPGETIRIPLYEIRYLDVHQNYTTIHAAQEYTVKKTLAEFEPLLDDRFFRACRSCILNLTFVRRVTRSEVTLTDGSSLPLPRGQYEPLNRALISKL